MNRRYRVARNRVGSMTTRLTTGDGQIASLDTKVGVLEGDIADVGTRLENLDAKFEKVMASFASEFRTAIAALSTQLSERNKTPWGILISGAGVVLTVVALVGHQALSPMTDDIARLTKEAVPRKEIEARYAYTDARINVLSDEVRMLRQHEFDGLTHQIEVLERENSSLKHILPGEAPR